MNLITAVTNIISKRVTEEEAKQFALDNYGVLAAYIRHEFARKQIKKPRTVQINKKVHTIKKERYESI